MVRSPEPVAILEHDEGVRSGSFSPDGRYIATHTQFVIRIWRVSDLLETQGNHPTASGVLHEGANIRYISFSSDGSYALVVSDARAKIYQMSDLLEGVTQESGSFNHDNIIFHGTISPDGSLILSCSGKDIRLWSLRELVTETSQDTTSAIVILKPGEDIRQCIFSPDGNYILIIFLRTNSVRIWRLTDVLPPGYSLSPEPSPSLSLNPSPEPVTTSAPLDPPEPVAILEHNDLVQYSTFNQNGNYILTCSLNNTARLWWFEDNVYEAIRSVNEQCNALIQSQPAVNQTAVNQLALDQLMVNHLTVNQLTVNQPVNQPTMSQPACSSALAYGASGLSLLFLLLTALHGL